MLQVWGKTGGKIYGNKTGEDFVDNQLRFSLFAQAAIEAPRVLNLTNSPHYDRPYGEPHRGERLPHTISFV
jgi:granule-bound starch synthase